MTLYGLIFAVSLKIIYVENRVIQNETDAQLMVDDGISPYTEAPSRVEVGVRVEIDSEDDPNFIDFTMAPPEEVTEKPCSVVVLSNIQNPNMQSLIRKYRYDDQGILIPGSVKYFIKLPQGMGLQPVLVPVNDQAFSPLGGFVRYYKEVPPIPQSW